MDPEPTPTPDPAPEPTPQPTPDRTFTQADVDRIVSERLARDRREQPTADELAALRDKAGKWDEAEAANRTELETAQQALAAAQQSEAAANELVQTTLRQAAIISAAAQAGAVDPSEVHAILAGTSFEVAKGDEKITVTVGDDGQVTGAKEAVEALLAAKQHLVGTTPDPGPGGGGVRTTPPGALTKEALEQMTPQQVAALKPEDVAAALRA